MVCPKGSSIRLEVISGGSRGPGGLRKDYPELIHGKYVARFGSKTRFRPWACTRTLQTCLWEANLLNMLFRCSCPLRLLDRHYSEATEMLSAGLRKAFTTVLAALCPPHSAGRCALKRGDIVVRMSCPTADDTDGEAVWLHVAYVNLSSWVCCFRRLHRSSDVGHRRRASPHTALEAHQGDEWMLMWTIFRSLDLQTPRAMELWCLCGPSSHLLPRLCPWQLQARRWTPQDEFWSGPPALRAGRRRRLGRGDDADDEALPPDDGDAGDAASPRADGPRALHAGEESDSVESADYISVGTAEACFAHGPRARFSEAEVFGGLWTVLLCLRMFVSGPARRIKER